MSASFPNVLAEGVTDEGTFLPFELWAGEAKIITQPFVAAEDIDQFQVVVLNSSGEVAVWNGTDFPGGAEATMVPVPFGIASTAIASGDSGGVYVGGFFNHKALVWPGGAATLVNRKRAFAGNGSIFIGEPAGAATAMTLP